MTRQPMFLVKPEVVQLVELAESGDGAAERGWATAPQFAESRTQRAVSVRFRAQVQAVLRADRTRAALSRAVANVNTLEPGFRWFAPKMARHPQGPGC